ncbi:MAG: hypothetical protein U5K70_09680 [Halodesulfurarchaeum sp.]|nr:hypothetical protein [Halodesulfurarchaeum sp.]
MDRGVSDVLGYVLVFSLILGSVALVSTAGYTSLDSVRDAERFDNANRVFEVLDANVDDHIDSGVPSRATEIRLADARIGFGEPVRFNVSVEDFGYNRTTADPLVYTQSADRTIAYSGGATIRSDRGYSRLTDGPPFRFGERTVLTFVQTRARDTGISGSGRVMVRTTRATQSVHSYRGSGPYHVTLNVTTDRPRRGHDGSIPNSMGSPVRS